jgi:ACS family glucarate transporter-like MFS transporter
MLLSIIMVACNFTTVQTVVMVLMSVAFFGKGFGALGWTVIADTSPRELIGLNGGIFNLFGNIAGITTPIIIGLLVKRTGSFRDALIFVGATALLAIFSYLVIVGEIKRLEIHTPRPRAGTLGD